MTVTTYQSDYSKTQAKGLPGQVSSEEKSNRISRTVESAGGIAFGQPAFRGSGDNGCVVGATFAGTGTPTAVAGNTGNGVFGAVTISAGAVAGNYSVVVIEPGTNAGVFEVRDPYGEFVGRGSIASAFSAGGIAFTIADGATDFVSGDAWTVLVAFTTDIVFLGLTILNPSVPANATTPDSYPRYFTAALMTMGTMWVTAGATVAQGDLVYWNPATKRFTNTATHVRIPGARFEGAAVDGGMVEISIRLRS